MLGSRLREYAAQKSSKPQVGSDEQGDVAIPSQPDSRDVKDRTKPSRGHLASDAPRQAPLGAPDSPLSLYLSTDRRGSRIRSGVYPLDTVEVETTLTHNYSQATLGTVDRIKAANKSRKIKERVVSSAQSSFLDYHIRFLPEGKLYEVVNSEAVSHELTRSRKRPIATDAPERYRKILTVLYFLDLPTKIRLFVQRGVRDEDLPFEIIDYEREGNSVTALKSRDNPMASAVPFKRRRDAERFAQRQWSVLAYIFKPQHGTCVPHYILRDEEILPFQSQRRPKRPGASGRVFETRIYPEHHFWDDYKFETVRDRVTCNVFAVKTLDSKDKAAFEQEVKILQKLTKGTHEHKYLITLLATYEHKSVYNLIFPCAKTDLFGFWKHYYRPPKTQAMAQWLAEQCIGLAEGLHHIHHWETFTGSSIISDSEPSNERNSENLPQVRAVDTSGIDLEPIRLIGRHGDIKPENILWFPNGKSPESLGTLKITDFGIARFGKTYSRQGHMPNSPSYRSPEYELFESHSPACDVWALGCVYLELTTWYCGGYNFLMESSRKRLAADRKFHEIQSDAFFTVCETPDQPGVRYAKVKDSVLDLMKDLLGHPTCEEFPQFKELLEITRDHMLVVRPTPPDVHNTPPELSSQYTQSHSSLPLRKSAGHIFQVLGDMKVFVDDPNRGIPRQSTHNIMNVHGPPTRSATIGSIPEVLGGSLNAPSS